jgi:uncharacterized damage-inducible protein DinB/predicted RNase H-like HicB family nuclease
MEETDMRLQLAIEEIEPNHWVAYALNLPGCFSSATSPADAISQAPKKIAHYFVWLSAHNVSPSVANLPIETEVVEQVHSFESREEPGYIVNAFFEDDRRPLGYWDVEVALRLMEWTRQDLLVPVQDIESKRLNQPFNQEKFMSIGDILKHVAGAENWYLGQMGFSLKREQLPSDVFEMLTVVRENAKKQLTNLVGESRITQTSGEYWSGRKVLRRLLWHERDHTHHIAQLLEL